PSVIHDPKSGERPVARHHLERVRVDDTLVAPEHFDRGALATEADPAFHPPSILLVPPVDLLLDSDGPASCFPVNTNPRAERAPHGPLDQGGPGIVHERFGHHLA